jgi:sulfur relay (sulfurtransferase) complex TusBCD TusD component (DsrE family)
MEGDMNNCGKCVKVRGVSKTNGGEQGRLDETSSINPGLVDLREDE